jgi:hypothetical protein
MSGRDENVMSSRVRDRLAHASPPLNHILQAFRESPFP